MVSNRGAPTAGVGTHAHPDVAGMLAVARNLRHNHSEGA